MGLLHVLSLYAQQHLGLSITRAGKEYRAQERYVLRRSLAAFEIDCVFDVGANSGQFADLVRESGFKGPIVSFAPVPELAAGLRRRAAGRRDWFVEELALDERVHDVEFHVMSMTQFSSLLRPSTRETASQSRLNTVSKTIQVTTGTLEAAFDKYQRRLGFRRPFLKMDTQGKDVDVARGAGDRLQQFAAIMTELAVKRLYDGQPDFRQALEFYFDRGFEVAAMLPTHPHFPQMIEVDCVLHNPALTDRPQAS